MSEKGQIRREAGPRELWKYSKIGAARILSGLANGHFQSTMDKQQNHREGRKMPKCTVEVDVERSAER